MRNLSIVTLSKRQRGFSMVAILIIIPSLLVLAGTAVTVAIGLNIQHQLGTASESAAMYFAKRKVLTGDEATQTQVREFMAQFTSVGNIDNIEIINIANGYRIKANSSVPIFMMPQLGNSFKVSNQGAASVEYNNNSKVDIVLLLDLSPSQILGLQDTIDNLHRIISTISARYEPGNIRIGVMAFSFLPSIVDADWLPQSFSGIECVSSTVFIGGMLGANRPANANKTVDNLFTLPNNLRNIAQKSRPLDTTFLNEGCPDVGSLLPTSDLNKVKQHISSHTQRSNAQVSVYHHALIYGARMLDEGWASAWDTSYVDIGERKKAVIAIGDGADGAIYTTEFSNLINAGMCDEIRDNDVELYFLHYGVDFRENSNIERCVTSENTKAMSDIEEVIDQLIGDVNPSGHPNSLTMKLIP